MKAEETLYYNADQSKLVGPDSDEQAFLAVPKGGEIPAEMVEKFKIKDGKLPKAKKAPAKKPAEKKAPAKSNKSKKAAENKAKK